MFADFDDNRSNDAFLDEARQKLGSDFGDSLEERRNEISRSKNVFIGTVSGIALAAVVGWFVLAPRYAGDNPADIPVVRRPQTAVKVQPAEPGGMEILNQDKSVYDIIEKKETPVAAVENLLPPPEEPQVPEVAPVVAPEVVSETVAVVETVATPAAAQVVVAEAPSSVPAAPAVELPTPQVNPTPTVEIKAAPIVAPEPTPEPAPAPQAAPAPTASGPWQVQLISSPNRKAVDSAWAELVKKYPMLKDQPREIETADLGSKGTFYRLKAGGFADRSGADRLCGDIKALGGTCFVKKK